MLPFLYFPDQLIALCCCLWYLFVGDLHLSKSLWDNRSGDPHILGVKKVLLNFIKVSSRISLNEDLDTVLVWLLKYLASQPSTCIWVGDKTELMLKAKDLKNRAFGIPSTICNLRDSKLVIVALVNNKFLNSMRNKWSYSKMKYCKEESTQYTRSSSKSTMA